MNKERSAEMTENADLAPMNDISGKTSVVTRISGAAAKHAKERALRRERFSNRRAKLGTAAAVRLFLRDSAGEIKREPAVLLRRGVPVICIGAVAFAGYSAVSAEKLTPAEAAPPETASVFSTASVVTEPSCGASADSLTEGYVVACSLEHRISGKFPYTAEASLADGELPDIISAQEEDIIPADASGEGGPAYVVFADNTAIGIVEDFDKIEEFLDGLKAPYYKIDGVGEGDVFFDKTISYEERAFVPSYIIQDQKDIIRILNGKETESDYYEVAPGDNLWAIASKLGMELDELRARPAKYNGKEVELGDRINVGTLIELESDEPFLSIEYRHLVETEKAVPFDTITYEDSTLAEGKESVISEGLEGRNVVTTLVTYKVVTDENGDISGKPIRKKTISDKEVYSPTARVVGVGTKRPAIRIVTRGTNAGSGDYFWPVEGGYISDTFVSNRNHKGLDIAAPFGTPVFAAADGCIAEVGEGWCGGYGNNVKIQNDDGNFTVYAHMSQTQAEVGTHVSAGDVIGYIGSTGDSTGNHLHFEVRYDGCYYDPEEFVSQ